MFPRSFRAFVRERLLVWGLALGFLASLFVAVEVIHSTRLDGHVAEMAQLARTIESKSPEALERFNALRGQLDQHVASNARNKMLLSVLIVFALGMIGFFEFRWLVRPIARMSEELSAGTGRLATVETVAMRRDDLGVMGRALLAHHRDAERRAAASNEQIRALDEKVAGEQAFRAASLAFQREIAAIVAALEAEAERMAGASGALSKLASEVRNQSGEATGATKLASGDVAGIAATFETFADGIARISTDTGRAAEAAGGARTTVHAADEDTAALGEAVELIGAVVALISDVANKTNLLALNAAIEAARVGEHGRGFAVVAAEVKQLAQTTSAATNDVRGRLDIARAAAMRISGRIGALVGAVDDVSAASDRIAEMMRQQGDQSQAIHAGAARAADTMQSVARRIADVSRMAEETHGSAAAASAVSEELGRQAAKLGQAVEAFLAASQRSAA